MPRSRSRERERRNRSRDRDRRSRSKSRDRRRSKDRSDYKRRDRTPEKYSSSKRDKYDSYKRRSRERSYDRSSHRNRSSERDRKRRDSRDRRRSSSRSKRQRSNSSDKKTSHSTKSQLSPVKPIVIIANQNKKSSKNRHQNNEAGKSNNAQDHRASFEISNEFSQEGFEQFGRDHGIDFTNIETDEDRAAVHEKMEELLKAHFAAQGKVYPPPKVEKPVVNNATGFANDGSFLEQFKKMQEEYKQKQETQEKKQQTMVNNLKNLPINKRRGAKILKTGLVAKTIVTSEGTITTNAYDSYYKEVQKYKNSSSCDSSDSKTRPLVK